MKFAASILLFTTLTSASILDRGVNYFTKRDAAAPSASATTITVPRDPNPNDSALQTALLSLSAIKDLTINSTYTVGNFTGASISDALAIQASTGVLNDATYNATLACAKIANLSVSDSETLGKYTQGLAYAVNASIATLISKKPAFDKLKITSLVLTSLNALATGSYGFSVTLLQKVPTELQIISEALSSQIGHSIGQGIECFSGKDSSCITAIVDPDRTKSQAIANDTISDANSIKAAGFTALAVAIFAAMLAF